MQQSIDNIIILDKSMSGYILDKNDISNKEFFKYKLLLYL